MAEESNASPNATIIWAWSDAPRQLRELSGNGGDENWVVMLPGDWEYWPWYFQNHDGEDYLPDWGHAEWHDYGDWRIVIFSHA